MLVAVAVGAGGGKDLGARSVVPAIYPGGGQTSAIFVGYRTSELDRRGGRDHGGLTARYCCLPAYSPGSLRNGGVGWDRGETTGSPPGRLDEERPRIFGEASRVAQSKHSPPLSDCSFFLSGAPLEGWIPGCSFARTSFFLPDTFILFFAVVWEWAKAPPSSTLLHITRYWG